ncbi:DoxX family membrane protein [Arthrobacter roseus]|uniref:DoxX family membrane protein n=1 Tax=Arthrobacter roseus TaxID=136274 RepID=UPI00196376A5|nr:DoxX family membrane protein [Arthrobacter roseus]MBM7847916.1 hypothetical protein [Arthrobacter roseus]
MKLSHLPLRLATGAFILNSGVSKLNLDKDTAGYLQGMASNAFPQAGKLEPEKFGKALSAAEITVGAMLLAPFVPSRLAGLALAAFSGGLLTMYFKTPELTEEDGIRPSQDGIAVAKDSWMAAIALALIFNRKHKKSKK